MIESTILINNSTHRAKNIHSCSAMVSAFISTTFIQRLPRQRPKPPGDGLPTLFYYTLPKRAADVRRRCGFCSAPSAADLSRYPRICGRARSSQRRFPSPYNPAHLGHSHYATRGRQPAEQIFFEITDFFQSCFGLHFRRRPGPLENRSALHRRKSQGLIVCRTNGGRSQPHLFRMGLRIGDRIGERVLGGACLLAACGVGDVHGDVSCDLFDALDALQSALAFALARGERTGDRQSPVLPRPASRDRLPGSLACGDRSGDCTSLAPATLFPKNASPGGGASASGMPGEITSMPSMPSR